MHPSKRLWEAQSQFGDYPAGVLPITKAIPGTSFFPGGYGLLNDRSEPQLPPFPRGGVMVLGHDFHSEDGYNASLARTREAESQPTWRNLLLLLREAEIAPEQCFFTNLFLGLRAGSSTTGRFPGSRSQSFVEYCQQFFLLQLREQAPRLILTLGVYAPYYIAPLSPELGDWGKRVGFKYLDKRPVQHNVTFSQIRSFSTTVVPLVHPSFRHLSVRLRTYGGAVGAEAELQMLRDAAAGATVASV